MKKILFISLIALLISLSAISAADNTTALQQTDYTNITHTPEKVSITCNSFKDFKDKTEKCVENQEIKINHNMKVKSPIYINKNNVTIDGQGHKLQDEKNQIFVINSDNVVIKNLRIVNIDGHTGGQIYINGKNCTLQNLNYSYIMCNAIINNGSCRVVNSTFYYNSWSSIYSKGDLVCENCRFDKCYSEVSGAIYSHKTVNISNCKFNGNKLVTQKYGGAICCPSINCNNCTFENNYAEFGGAIYLNGKGKSNITNSRFITNAANEDGGAIYNKGDLNIQNTEFKINQANGAVFCHCEGGAIYSEGNLEIHGSKFEENTAEKGGAIYAEKNLNVYNTTFKNNTANGAVIYKCEGGAIYSNKNLNIQKSTFIKNNAEKGGSIFAHK